MTSKIYTEAIAEAKHLREVAEQNAKNAIVDAVTPKIREFIDNQLLGDSTDRHFNDSDAESIIMESIGIEESNENNEYVNLDNGALSALANLIGANSENKTVLAALAESVNSMGSNNAKLIDSAAKKILHSNDSFKSNRINNVMSDTQENSKMGLNEVVYDVDINLLKEEMDSHSRAKNIDDAMSEEDTESKMFAEDADEISDADKKELQEMLASLGILNEDVIEIDLGDVELPDDLMPVASVVRDEEDEDDDLEVMDVEDDMDADDVESPLDDLDSEEDLESLDEVLEIDPRILRQELLRVRNLVREAKSLADSKGGADSMEASWGGKGNAKVGLKNQWGGKGSGKGNAFGGGSEKGDVFKVKINALAESLKKEQRKNRALESRLDEYRGAVETLREQLTDLNLFNAKLLYVNKLFQDKSVAPGKRRSMMESIDAAKSLREVKLIYKTLTSARSDRSSLNESTARTLGSSSRSVGRSSATSTTNDTDRWATLAGIK